MIRYGIWHDEEEQDYSIIRWDDQPSAGAGPHLRAGRVVQTGIRTREKAEAAQKAWQQREASRHV